MASCPRCSSGQGCLLLAAGASWGGSGVGSAGQLFLPLPVPWRCSTDGAGPCCGPVSSCFKRANTQYFGGAFPSPGLHPSLLPSAVPCRKAAPIAQGAQPAGTQPPAFLGNGDDCSVRAPRSAASVVTRAGSQHWGAFMCVSAFALLPHVRQPHSFSSMFCCLSWPVLWKDVGVIPVL